MTERIRGLGPNEIFKRTYHRDRQGQFASTGGGGAARVGGSAAGVKGVTGGSDAPFPRPGSTASSRALTRDKDELQAVGMTRAAVGHHDSFRAAAEIASYNARTTGEKTAVFRGRGRFYTTERTEDTESMRRSGYFEEIRGGGKLKAPSASNIFGNLRGSGTRQRSRNKEISDVTRAVNTATRRAAQAKTPKERKEWLGIVAAERKTLAGLKRT